MVFFRQANPVMKLVTAFIVSSMILSTGSWRLSVNQAQAAPKGKPSSAPTTRVYVLGMEVIDGATIKDKNLSTMGLIKDNIETALKDNKDISLVSDQELNDRLQPPPVEGSDIKPSEGVQGSDKDIANARKQMKRGYRSVEEESFEDALEQFEEAELLFRKAPDKADDKVINELKRLYVGWAWAAFEVKEPKTGVKAMERLLALDPDYELNEDEYYPRKMVAEFKSLKERKASASFNLTVYPKVGATVWINGRKQASSSFTLTKLNPGSYWVRISADEYDSYANIWEVERSESFKIKLGGGPKIKADDPRDRIANAKKSLPFGKFDKEFHKNLSELCQKGSVDFVVFGLFYPEDKNQLGFAAFVYSAKDGRIASLQTMKARGMDRAITLTERRVRAMNQYFERFPSKTSKYYFAPGVFDKAAELTGDGDEAEEAMDSEDGEDGEDDDDDVAPVMKGKAKAKAQEPADEDDDEETAVVATPAKKKSAKQEDRKAKKERVEEQEDGGGYEPEPAPEPAPAPKVKKKDLDTDVSFLLSESDQNKRSEDMSQKKETGFVDEQPPFYTQWWFWTIIGVAVAGGAVTAGVLLAPEGPNNSSTVQFNINK